MTTLANLFGNIFPGDTGNTPFAPRPPAEFTPAVKSRHVFELEDVRMLLMWDSPRAQYNRNLLLTGPTGCGKTELPFQFAARTGRELFRYSCHERTDYADLVGTMTILPDGSTGFQDGPLTQAMKRGGIFLLDEVNAARPGSLIGLNGVLDGAESITVPGSGEVVKRHHDFRIAVTGNSMTRDETAQAFRGTQTMNAAFLDRFFVMEKDYLPVTVETKALFDYLEEMAREPMYNPNGVPVPGELPAKMISFANKIRQDFKQGNCDITVSTRGLFAFAEMVALRWTKVVADPQPELSFIAKATLIGKTSGIMREALMKGFDATVSSQLRFATVGTAAKARPKAAEEKAYNVMFRVNPERSSGGAQVSTDVAFWGYAWEGSSNAKTQCQMFNGMLTGSNKRAVFPKGTKAFAEAAQASIDKRDNRGYKHGFTFVLTTTDIQAEIKSLAAKLSAPRVPSPCSQQDVYVELLDCKSISHLTKI